MVQVFLDAHLLVSCEIVVSTFQCVQIGTHYEFLASLTSVAIIGEVIIATVLGPHSRVPPPSCLSLAYQVSLPSFHLASKVSSSQ